MIPNCRKALSIEGLLKLARGCFSKIPGKPGCPIPLVDHLMSGLALFGLKYPSLLQFDQNAREDETIAANIKSLYGIKTPPSDTCFRERLDELNPTHLRPLYKEFL